MKKHIILVFLCAAITVVSASGCSITSEPTVNSNSVSETPSPETDITETVASDEDEIAAYTDFLDGKTKVKISDKLCSDDDANDWSCSLSGECDFDGLHAAISEYEDGDVSAKYALADLGKDGTKELILRFESVELSRMNWTGIIHRNGNELILNYFYEDGYRSSSVLYDSGYLLIGGANGAGSHCSTLTGFDKDGNGYDIFTVNEYIGSFAESIEYNLNGNGADSSDNHAIPYESELAVTELVTDEGIKIAVLGGWSEDEPIRYEEDDYISYLVSLGAERISAEEMEQLTSLLPYQSNEVVWTLIDGNNQTSD